MPQSGWIKLYRQIMECSVLWDSTDEPFDRRSAWIDLLLLANHKDTRIMFRGQPTTVKMGQRLTSIQKLAERWNWGINRVRHFLDMLQGEGMLIRESDNTKTLITIVNYQKYQGVLDIEDGVTDGVTDGLIDGVTNGLTDGAQMDSQMESQMTNKNDKELKRMNKNEKNEKKIYGEYHHVRLTDSERERLDIDYGVEKALDLITYLDEYIEMKGYKAKNHNLAIRKWVVDAIEKQKKKPSSGDVFHDDLQRIADWSKDEWGGQ